MTTFTVAMSLRTFCSCCTCRSPAVEHHQPELEQLGIRVGDVALHELLVRQATALRLAAQAFAHHVQRFAGKADGAHGMVNRPPPSRVWAMTNGLAAEQRFGRHPHVVVVDERM